MATEKIKFYPKLRPYITQLLEEADLIPGKRKEVLNNLIDYIKDKRLKDDPVKLVFICTHNSRRSQISQIWATTAAAWYGLDFISSYSGGTEVTAFNPRAIAAMKRAGFHIEDVAGTNPHYKVHFSGEAPPVDCFSKTYDAPSNPQKDIAAVMTCSEADENCPYIPGAAFRVPLTYDDPKEADGTPEEGERYDERVHQIGREIFYVLQSVNQNIKSNE